MEKKDVLNLLLKEERVADVSEWGVGGGVGGGGGGGGETVPDVVAEV